MAAGLINGLTITPLTGTRKIILLVLVSCLVAGSVDYLRTNIKNRQILVLIFSLLAISWVFWKVVARMEATEMTLFAIGSTALLLWLLWIFELLGDDEAHLHGAGLSLLLGTGLSAIAAASALLGQLALSLSAASGGVLLAWVLLGRPNRFSHRSMPTATLPYALAATLLGLAAVIFARLPWYALIPLASIPLATRFIRNIPNISNTRFINAVVASLPGLLIALIVSFLVWQTGNSSSGY